METSQRDLRKKMGDLRYWDREGGRDLLRVELGVSYAVGAGELL